MTKIITIFIIVLVCYCGYLLFQKWESVNQTEEAQKKQAAEQAVQGDNLPGLPYQLENGYRGAKARGNTAMRDWLKAYGNMVQDPRKAWIEMDFCVAISRDDPAEARRILKTIKARTPPDSPVLPRVLQLEKSFQ